jgi:hypothetical protein
VDVNSIANRTLISDETNGKVKDKAPAAYLQDSDVFPSGPRAKLLKKPHFVDDSTLPILQEAREDLSDDELAALYKRFLQARQAAMVNEIRRACGVDLVADRKVEREDPDEPAADVQADTALPDEPIDDLELEAVG